MNNKILKKFLVGTVVGFYCLSIVKAQPWIQTSPTTSTSTTSVTNIDAATIATAGTLSNDTTGNSASSTAASNSPTVYSGNNTFYVAPWGSDLNAGTATNYPLATLFAASRLASNGAAIHIFSGVNSNELVFPTNIQFAPNISVDAEPGSWIIFTNVETLTGAKNFQINPNAGDIINNLGVILLDSAFDTSRSPGFGWNNTFSVGIAQTNPCIVNNLRWISQSVGIHFEASTSPFWIIFNSPYVLAQGQCFNSISSYENITVNNPTFILTNWYPTLTKDNSSSKPLRVLAFGQGSVGGAAFSQTIINSGSFYYSDSTTTNIPSCAVFQDSNSTNVPLCVLNGVTFIPSGITNANSFDIISGYGITTPSTNALILNSVVKSTGGLITETNTLGVGRTALVNYGITTNLQFTDNNLLNPSTNTMYFTNGILMKVTQP